MSQNVTKIINLEGHDGIDWENQEFSRPVVIIVGEEVLNEETKAVEKKYYYALVRYADDGAEHVCVDKTLPLTKDDLALIDNIVFTKVGNNLILRGMLGTENISSESDSIFSDLADSNNATLSSPKRF